MAFTLLTAVTWCRRPRTPTPAQEMTEGEMATSQGDTGLDPHTNLTVDPQTEYLYQNISHYPFSRDREYQAGLAAILGHPDTPATEDEVLNKADLVLQAQLFYFARKYNVHPIDPVAYSAWLQTQELSQAQAPQHPQHPSHLSHIQHPTRTTFTSHVEPAAEAAVAAPPATATSDLAPAQTQTQTPSSAPQAQAETEAEPPYPTSFAAIVDLITRNIPVPGIEEIPDTVLEPGSSKVDKNPRRKKPWEKDTPVVEAETETTGQEQGQPEAQSQAASAGEEAPTAQEDINVNGHKETGQGVVNILKPNAVPDSGLLSKD